jgi:DNA-binding GntR family transcriptional regulator
MLGRTAPPIERLGIRAMPIASDISKLPSKTRRGWVVKIILNAIFTGEFRGGDRLVEEELAVSIGVSRTPVRDALGELAGFGVIELKPNHGAVVCPFGPTQIRELYHVRGILESESARLAATRGLLEPQTLTNMRLEHEELLHADPRPTHWSGLILTLDQRFHEMVSRASGSVRLAEEIERYRGLVSAIREAVGNTAHAQDVALVEHMRVIDRLIARDGDGAADAMTRHISRGTEAAVTALFSNTRQRAANGSSGSSPQESAPRVHIDRRVARERPNAAHDQAV